MHNLPTEWLLLAAFAVGACETAPTESAPVDFFVGRWSCTETRTLTFAAPAGSPDATTQTQFTLSASAADGQLTTSTSNGAGASCQLNFKENGSSALLMDGQACMTLDGITLTYRMGTADIGTTGLQTNLVFEFAGALATDGGSPLDASGSGTTTSTCVKMRPPSAGGGATSGGATSGGGW